MITVAICTWNRSQALRATLNQLTRMRIPDGIDWELLIVNNNCTDDTDRVCDVFRDRLPLRVLHEPTLGKAHAATAAIRESRGKYLAWTDDDVLVEPEWLEALLDALVRYQAAWVFGVSEPLWPDQAPRWYSARFRARFAVLDYGNTPFEVRDRDHPFFGLNVAGTREAHQALKGFRTDFGPKGTGGSIGEDIDLFERALSAGMRIVYTPHARVRHMIHPDRVRKQYHRHRQWGGTEGYYRHLNEIFPEIPWLLGVPRFFFSKAAHDALRYLRASLTADTGERFEAELNLIRFGGLIRQSARQYFQRTPPGTAHRDVSSDGE